MILKKGKIHGIMGFNGSGKTVMFKCICGFLQPESGTVLVGGKTDREGAGLSRFRRHYH